MTVGIHPAPFLTAVHFPKYQRAIETLIAEGLYSMTTGWLPASRERIMELMSTLIKTADVLAANPAGFIRHVETADRMLVEKYAAMPADTAPAIRVRKNLRVEDGWHRLAAAKARGDEFIRCVEANLQEELSA